jgi:hypothetical protein
MAEITYFDSTGESNTSAALKIALERYHQGGIDAVILASTFGKSALQAAQVFAGSGAKLLVVGEVLDGKQSPPEEIRKSLESQGHRVVWGTTFHDMAAFTHDQTASVVAECYRRLSEGFKVVCEMVLIATGQGYLQPGQQVLAIAGTPRGSDTVVVATAASFSNFKDFEINEILCKPYRRSKN